MWLFESFYGTFSFANNNASTLTFCAILSKLTQSCSFQCPYSVAFKPLLLITFIRLRLPSVQRYIPMLFDIRKQIRTKLWIPETTGHWVAPLLDFLYVPVQIRSRIQGTVGQVFRGFSQTLKGNFRVVPKIRPRGHILLRLQLLSFKHFTCFILFCFTDNCVKLLQRIEKTFFPSTIIL